MADFKQTEGGIWTPEDINQGAEIVDQTRLLVELLSSVKSITSSINESQSEQRDLTQEAIDSAVEQATLASDKVGSLKSESEILRGIIQDENIAYNLGLMKLEIMESEVEAKEDLIAGIDEEIKKSTEAADKKKEDLDQAKKLSSQMGVTKGVLKGISKIPFLGDLIKSSDVLAAMEDAGDDMMDRWAAGAEALGKSLWANLGPAMFASILKMAFTFNTQITDLQKNLGASRGEALAFRDHLSAVSDNSEDILASSRHLLKTNQSLNDIRGTAIKFDDETLLQANRLLTTKVLTVEAVGELSRLTNVTGGTIRGNYLNQIDAVMAVEKEHKTRLNMKKVLEDANKVTGQIRAQLGANPAALAEAVAKAASLGTELESIAAAGKTMLDFEGSINAELEAELLTGKDLNLERARAAALSGDQVALMEEINANVGDFAEFSEMNTLQQDALARAFGMTSNQMSDMLLKQADLAAMTQEERNLEAEDVAKNLEKLSAQEEFNEAMLRLQDIFVDKIAPHMEKFVNWIVEAASNMGTLKVIFGGVLVLGILKVVSAIGKMVKLLRMARSAALGEAIAKGWSAAMSAGPLSFFGGLALGAVITAAIGAAVYSTMDDGIVAPSGYGDNTIISKTKGGMKMTMLNNDDTIIAGTNLGGGGGGVAIDYDKMATAMANTQIGVSVRNNPWASADQNAWGGDHQTSNRYGTSLT